MKKLKHVELIEHKAKILWQAYGFDVRWKIPETLDDFPDSFQKDKEILEKARKEIVSYYKEARQKKD